MKRDTSPVVLVVDDDSGIRSVVCSYLEDIGLRTITANSGRSGIEVAQLEKPDLILSDIRMSDTSGIEFFHWNKNSLGVAFVFMTGFSEQMTLEEAVEMGANGFILKPFDKDELKNMVAQAVEIPDQAKKKNLYQDEDFCKLDLSRFVTGNAVPCSIFVRIKKDHYVKLADKQELFTSSDLDRYREKKVKFLYVLKDEFKDFVGFNMKLLGRIEKEHSIPKNKVLNFINYTNSIIIEDTFVSGLSPHLIDEVTQYSQATLHVLKERKALFDMIANLSSHSERVYAHSLSTAIMAYLVAKKMNWKNEGVLFKVFLSGLLHDVGLKYIPVDVLHKNRVSYSAQEKKTYEDLPVRAMEALNSVGNVPEEVILAAYQHHEDCLGHGFPQGIKKSKISPISRLISVVDILDDNMIGSEKISLDSYKKACESVKKLKVSHYDSQFLTALTLAIDDQSN